MPVEKLDVQDSVHIEKKENKKIEDAFDEWYLTQPEAKKTLVDGELLALAQRFEKERGDLISGIQIELVKVEQNFYLNEIHNDMVDDLPDLNL